MVLQKKENSKKIVKEYRIKRRNTQNRERHMKNLRMTFSQFFFLKYKFCDQIIFPDVVLPFTLVAIWKTNYFIGT